MQCVFCRASETAQSSDVPPNLHQSSNHIPSTDMQCMVLLLIASLQLSYPFVYEANLMYGIYVLLPASWLL